MKASVVESSLLGRAKTRARAAFASGLAISLCLLWAGLSKMVDVPGFEGSLSTWSLFASPAVRWPIAIAVPMVEILLACSWLLGVSRRRVAFFQAVLVLGFAAGYSVEVYGGGRPHCSCFGVLVARHARAEELWWVLGRDILIATAGVISGILSAPVEAGDESC